MRTGNEAQSGGPYAVTAGRHPVFARFAARIFDEVLLISLAAVVFMTEGYLLIGTDSDSTSESENLLTLVFSASVLILRFVYFVPFEALRGQSIGKWHFGLKITDLQGGTPSFAQAVLRFVLTLVSLLTLVALIETLAAIFADNNTRFVDRLTRTRIISVINMRDQNDPLARRRDFVARRILAKLIDTTILVLTIYFVLLSLLFIFTTTEETDSNARLVTTLTLIIAVWYVALIPGSICMYVFDYVSYGTPGKRLMQLKVESSLGGTASATQISYRTLLLSLSVALFLWPLDLFAMVLRKDARSITDLMTRTRVVPRYAS